MIRERIRVSELKSWVRCRRQAYLGYELGYQVEGLLAGIGTAVHNELAAYYAPNQPIFNDHDLSHLTTEDWAMVEAMVSTYKEEVEAEGHDIGTQTELTEIRFERDIKAITLTGQIDRLYYSDVLGGYVVQDHKTIARFASTADRDFQLMCYAWLVQDYMYREYGGRERVVAVEHNQIKRNKRTSRAKPPYIDRQTRLITEEALWSWDRHLNYIVHEYKNAMNVANDSQGVESPAIYPVGNNTCSYSCDFSDVCGMIDDAADYTAVLDSEFTKREEAPHHA